MPATASYQLAKDAFREAPDSDQRLFFDGVHPNRPGHRLYAQFVADKLRSLLEHGPGASNAPR